MNNLLLLATVLMYFLALVPVVTAIKSGEMICYNKNTMRFDLWIKRKEEPQRFWSLFAAEIVILCLLTFYFVPVVLKIA